MVGQGSPIVWTHLRSIAAMFFRSLHPPALLVTIFFLLNLLPSHMASVCAAEKNGAIAVGMGK